MIEDPEGLASAAAELGLSLLDAKLSVPHTRPGAVSRAPLIRTARASDRRVVGVTAPAGYGKSTLLAEWARTEDRQVAWVSLDRFDDDPAAFLFSLASAYGRITPDGEDLIADVGGLGVSVLGRAAPRLASAFRASPQPFVLMLDDLHELRSPACHDALGVAISGIPRAHSSSRRVVPSSRTCRGCGRRVTRWSSGPATWPSTRPAPRRSSRRHRSSSARRAGRRRDRAHRRLAGRPVPRCGDREREPRRGADGHRRRPVRGRLPLPRVVGAAARGRPAVPAAYGGARSTVRLRSAMRSSRRVGGQRAAARASRPRTCS